MLGLWVQLFLLSHKYHKTEKNNLSIKQTQEEQRKNKVDVKTNVHLRR